MGRKFPTKLIVIVGYSYTGSTLLSGVLTNVPRTLAFGEAHHMVASGFTCSSCGAACPVLCAMKPTRPDHRDLYLRVSEAAESLGYTTLVLSDKNLSTIGRYVNRHEAEAIFIFKNPLSFVSSYVRHKYTKDLDALPRLYSGYLNVLNMAEDYFRNVYVLQYERLATDPDLTAEHICAHFGLEKPPGKIVYPPPNWHNIGGNTGAYWGNEGNRSIHLDERWRTELTEAQIDQVYANQLYQKTRIRLQTRCPLPYFVER